MTQVRLRECTGRSESFMSKKPQVKLGPHKLQILRRMGMDKPCRSRLDPASGSTRFATPSACPECITKLLNPQYKYLTACLFSLNAYDKLFTYKKFTVTTNHALTYQCIHPPHKFHGQITGSIHRTIISFLQNCAPSREKVSRHTINLRKNG